MFYGIGGSTYGPLTTLDVCAHEIGHAACHILPDLYIVVKQVR